MNKIRVLMFSNIEITNTETRGSGNWVLSLINAFHKKNTNYDITIAFHDFRQRRIIRDKVGSFDVVKIPVRYAKTRVGGFLVNWMILDRNKHILEDYLDVINEVNPDIIQIFGLEGPFKYMIGNTKVPILIHIQGLPAPISYKRFLRIKDGERILASSIKSLIYEANFPYIENLRLQKRLAVERSIYHKCEYFLGRTDWDRRCVKATSPQAEYFYCQEIMRPEFYVAEWQPMRNKIVRLFTTIRQGGMKNIDMIFETAYLLEKYNPQFKYEWHIAGLKANDMVPKIMKQRGIRPQNIHLLGRLTSEDLIKQMLISDLFVYPSAIENGCNAVQEAMLVGIPVLATHAGGLSTTINDNITGLLVQEGDPYVMAGAILESVEKYDEAIEMAKKAKDIALQRHNPETVVNSLSEIYLQVINSKEMSKN